MFSKTRLFCLRTIQLSQLTNYSIVLVLGFSFHQLSLVCMYEVCAILRCLILIPLKKVLGDYCFGSFIKFSSNWGVVFYVLMLTMSLAG